MLLETEQKTAQPPLNLTQKLDSIIMEIQSYLVIIISVVKECIVKFVQVSSFVMCEKIITRFVDSIFWV